MKITKSSVIYDEGGSLVGVVREDQSKK